MKIIPQGTHGVVDYLLVVFLLASPTLFILPDNMASWVYLLGFFHLVLTFCTDYTSGIFRFFTFKMHGIIELVISVGLIVLAFTYLNYDERTKKFALTFGIILLIVYAFSDYSYVRGQEKPRVRRMPDPKTAA